MYLEVLQYFLHYIVGFGFVVCVLLKEKLRPSRAWCFFQTNWSSCVLFVFLVKAITFILYCVPNHSPSFRPWYMIVGDTRLTEKIQKELREASF